MGLALFLPAPGRAFGDTLVKEADGLPTKGALPPQFGQVVKGIFGDFSRPRPAENPAKSTIAESSSDAEESGRTLTEE